MNDRTTTAAGAMERANSAHHKIDSHEELCAERYKNIHETLGELKKLTWGVVLGGAGAVALTLMSVVLRAANLS